MPDEYSNTCTQVSFPSLLKHKDHYSDYFTDTSKKQGEKYCNIPHSLQNNTYSKTQKKECRRHVALYLKCNLYLPTFFFLMQRNHNYVNYLVNECSLTVTMKNSG